MNLKQYEQFKSSIDRNLKGLEFVSTGACPGCDDCGLSAEPSENEVELASEPSFSWQQCECCNSTLGGDRHPAHGIMVDSSKRQILHFSVCVDCLYYLNYGTLDDMSMMEMGLELERTV